MFASRGGVDELVPSALLALAADAASGSGRRCPGATGDERVGLVRAFAALESWAASGKLGVITEMIRRDDAPRPAGGQHGDLPDTWSASLRHELALALACSVQSAETTVWMAWELQARLPGIGALFGDGTLTLPKARAVMETFRFLTDADAATAESMILGQLKGKTYPQLLRVAEAAALTVDPGLAERRRLQAQKGARVTCFRELSGTAGLSGRDLPTDEALAAMAAVNARAQQYEDSGAFGTTLMDALRAYAYLDLLTGTQAEDRIRCAVAQDAAAESAEALAWANTRAARTAAQARAGREPAARTAQQGGPAGCPGGGSRPRGEDASEHPAPRAADGDDIDQACEQRDGPDNEPHSRGSTPRDNRDNDNDNDDDDSDGEPPDRDDDDGPDPDGPGGCGTGSPGPRSGAPSGGRAFQPRLPDLTVPLATLLRHGERPGEVQGFGLLDPGLTRDMAAAAVASARTEICLTVTSPEGWAIGHGCARPERAACSVQSSRTARSSGKPPPGAPPLGAPPPGAPPPGSAVAATYAALPARLNLTVSAAVLAELADPASVADSASPVHSGDLTSPRLWSFAARRGTGLSGTRLSGGTGPPDHYGTWVLALPDGRRFTVRLDVVPTLSCDHRYETSGYRPTARLRHLVQVRDSVCTFPSCNRHARECDFDHTRPYRKGGRTDACNAGARSRACHRVKQSPGWQATQQPKPGWHQWRTPAGRVYVQEPKRYTW
jgi:hypothetical protein